MLVISRGLNGGVRVGENIKVKVLRISQRRVTLGIDAPAEVSVRREEVADQQGERIEAEIDLRVLVVEDTPVHALLIERFLTNRGVKNVVRTSTGEDALRLLKLAGEDIAPKPDLILLDLQLPGVSGYEVLQTVRSSPELKLIPVVILSCSDADEDVSRCIAAGANAYVAKSERYDEFRRSIMRITDFWSQARRVTSRPNGKKLETAGS